MKITHTNGTVEHAASFATALELLRADYGDDVVVYDDEGSEVTGDEGMEHVTRALVWESEEDSRDDAGAKAVAKITR